MRTIQTAAPRRELRDFVRVFAQRCIPQGTCTAQSNVATLEQVIAFYLGGQTFLEAADREPTLAPDVTVFGSMSYPRGGARFAGDVIGFAIFLKPLGLQQLFGVPGAELINRDCEGRALLGSKIDRLLHQVEEKKTFEERVQIAEAFLLPLATDACVRNLVMRTACHMMRHKGAVRIDEIAAQAGLSLRQYQRRFAEEVGMSPKLFARVTRFQTALDAKRLTPQRSWLSVAHEFGYFDQMHMARDFQTLGGETPGQILRQSGDLQPWSVATSMAAIEL